MKNYELCIKNCELNYYLCTNFLTQFYIFNEKR